MFTDFLLRMRRFCKIDKLNNDFLACKLITKGLTAVLVLFFLHCAFMHYDSDNLKCLADVDEYRKIVETKCSISGTFSYDDPSFRKEFLSKLEADIPFYAADENNTNVFDIINNNRHESYRYHVLDNFVFVFFGLSAFSFLLPNWWWNQENMFLLQDIVKIFDEMKRITTKPDDVQVLYRQAVTVFTKSIDEQNMYYIRFGVLLLVYLGNVILQFLFIVTVFGQHDWQFGITVVINWSNAYHNWPAHLTSIFPMYSLCNVKYYALDRSVTMVTALCFHRNARSTFMMLALHWWMLVIVGGIVFLACVWHISCYASKKVRVWELCHNLSLNELSRTGVILNRQTYGTCFLLLLLSKNVSSHVICELISRLDTNM